MDLQFDLAANKGLSSADEPLLDASRTSLKTINECIAYLRVFVLEGLAVQNVLHG